MISFPLPETNPHDKCVFFKVGWGSGHGPGSLKMCCDWNGTCPIHWYMASHKHLTELGSGEFGCSLCGICDLEDPPVVTEGVNFISDNPELNWFLTAELFGIESLEFSSKNKVEKVCAYNFEMLCRHTAWWLMGVSSVALWWSPHSSVDAQAHPLTHHL